MSDTQSIGIPITTIVLAWLSNKADNAAMRAKMNVLRFEMIWLRTDFNSDMVGLHKEVYQALTPLHERMAVLELSRNSPA